MSAFLDNLGNSFVGAIDALTGKSRTGLTQQQIEIQAQIARDTLAQELESQRLKYSPELSKQRTKQLALVIIPVAIIAGLIIYFKFIR